MKAKALLLTLGIPSILALPVDVSQDGAHHLHDRDVVSVKSAAEALEMDYPKRAAVIGEVGNTGFALIRRPYISGGKRTPQEESDGNDWIRRGGKRTPQEESDGNDWIRRGGDNPPDLGNDWRRRGNDVGSNGARAEASDADGNDWIRRHNIGGGKRMPQEESDGNDWIRRGGNDPPDIGNEWNRRAESGDKTSEWGRRTIKIDISKRGETYPAVGYDAAPADKWPRSAEAGETMSIARNKNWKRSVPEWGRRDPNKNWKRSPLDLALPQHDGKRDLPQIADDAARPRGHRT